MKGPFDILAALNRTDESERFEAKESRSGQVGKAVYKTLSAFSNEPGLDGGYILFGVSRDDNGQYAAIGVSNPDKLQTELSSMCNDFNVPIRPRMQVEERDGVCLVSVFVPEAGISEKPVFRTAVGLPKGAFRRNGSSDVQCSERDLQVLFAARDGDAFDTSTFKGASLDDLDEAAIEAYRGVLRGRESGSGVSELSTSELLLGRHCARELDDGAVVPTVAGMVLFGTAKGLRREMPMTARVDYIRVLGTTWSDSSRSMETVVFREALVTVIPRIVNEVLAGLPTRFTFTSNSVERVEEPVLPRVAIREAIVNAVMHRDYRRAASVQIVRYNDRIEIANPGRSLKPMDRLDSHGSDLRNQAIALVLYDMQFAETMGSGVGRIKHELEVRGLPEARFENERFADEFTTVFPLEVAGQSGGTDGLSEGGEGLSGGSEGLSGGSEGLSGGSEGLSGGSGDPNARLTASLRRRVNALGKRASFTELIPLIIDLCRQRAFTPGDLAELLSRDRDHLVRHYLSPLAEEGRLQRLYPLGDPRQKYSTVNGGRAGDAEE